MAAGSFFVFAIPISIPFSASLSLTLLLPLMAPLSFSFPISKFTLFEAIPLIIVLQRGYFGLEFIVLLQHVSFLDARQNDVAHAFLAQQFIDELVHVDKFIRTHTILFPQLSIVIIQRLQILVTVQ
uniref:Uncharacterized protein n=1 Tax=Anopheles melas TaxID=34690 RepID=A0A182TVY3_9DIPT